MNSILNNRTLVTPALCCAALSLSILTGCQGHKIVARVKTATVTEDEYFKRVQRVTPQMLPQGTDIDAGGITIIGMVKELLTSQLAADKKFTPSEQSIAQFEAYYKRSDPNIAEALQNGQLTEEDLNRGIKLKMEEFAIGTDGAHAEDKDLQAAYDEQKDQLKIPEFITVRLLQAPDSVTAQQALDQLKKNASFKTIGTDLLHMPPQAAAAAEKGQTIRVDGILPELRTALASLTPGQFTDKPVEVHPQNRSTGAVQTLFVIGQMVRKTKEYIPSKEEIKPVLEQIAVGKTHPDWKQHQQQALADFTRNAVNNSEVQINIERYQKLLKAYILPIAENHTATAPGGSLAPPEAQSPQSAPQQSAPPPSAQPGARTPK